LKLLDSRTARFALAVAGYAAVLGVLCAMSEAAWYYLYNTAGFWIDLTPNFAVGLTFAVLLVYGWSCRRTAAQKNFLSNFDASSLLLLLFSGVAVSMYLLESGRFPMGELLLAVSAVLYAAGMLVYGELVRRLFSKTLFNNLVWPNLCKRFSPRRGIGLCMMMLLIVSWLCLLVSFPLGLEWLDGTFVTVFFTCTILLLTRAARHLLTLNDEYIAASHDKLRAEQFKSELITNVSHDIRTPLTSIISYVDLLRRLPIQHEDFRTYTAILESKSARLKALIDDLMQASKAGTGNLPVELRPIALAEIVGQIAGELDDRFTERGLNLVFRAPELSVIAQADSAHLWRVLENLFGNAAKYALSGTRVFAELSQADNGALFVLKNTSEAPLEALAGELTEQFIRGDRARQTEGNGLGLYIAKSLVQLMGGRFEINISGDLFAAAVWLPSGRIADASSHISRFETNQ